MLDESKPSLLLHCCCAPCSTHSIKSLQNDFVVTALFYNPNIHPRDEYLAREKEIRRLADKWDFPLMVSSYDSELWFEGVKGFEDAPEGGQRCPICFEMRLRRTEQLARSRGFDYFGTTLSISPHKNVEVINGTGRNLASEGGVRFLELDLKKKNGFRESCRLSEQEGLYRQNYCGCVFSQKEAENRRKGK